MDPTKKFTGVNDLITYKQWVKKLDHVKIRKQDMNRLVMNFLLTEGYDEAAVKLQLATAGTGDIIDIGKVPDAMAVKTALQSGHVQDAINKLNDMDPEILDTSPHLFFLLQQYRLIELIRNGKTEEALKCARDLAPTVEKNQSFLEDMEKTVALIGFEDPSNCPLGKLLDISPLIKFANKLNAAILTSQHFDQDSQLRCLLEKLIWVQNQLDEKVDYPRMNDLTRPLW